jgi:hypothetical protein
MFDFGATFCTVVLLVRVRLLCEPQTAEAAWGKLGTQG